MMAAPTLFWFAAHDAPGTGALRSANRPEHLARLQADTQRGVFVGGAVLVDADGAMTGSSGLFHAENLDAAWRWVRADPYALGGVWGSIEVSYARAWVPAT